MLEMSCVSAVVRQLLVRASTCAAAGLLPLSRIYFRAAMAADDTPVSRIVWGEFLLAYDSSSTAISELLSAWEESKRTGCPILTSSCCRLLSLAYRQAENVELSAAFHQRAVSAALDAIELGASFEQFSQVFAAVIESPDSGMRGPLAPVESIESWIHRGLAAKHHDSVFALKCLREAWRLCRHRPCTPARIRTLQAIAEVLCSCGKWSAGARMYRIAEELESEFSRRGDLSVFDSRLSPNETRLRN